MGKWVFPIENAIYEDGYTRVIIENFMAEIVTPAQVAIAKRHGGQVKQSEKRPETVEPKPAIETKRGKK